jgi:hypothetical protein
MALREDLRGGRDPYIDREFLEHHDNGTISGADPADLDRETIATRHPERTLSEAVRRKCEWCMQGDIGEVARCVSIACPLWPWRLNNNPLETPPPRARKAPPVSVAAAEAIPRPPLQRHALTARFATSLSLRGPGRRRSTSGNTAATDAATLRPGRGGGRK